MTINEIRSKFLNYFKEKGHTIVPGDSLIPHNDPSLLFTNAGMVQFKDVFLGTQTRPYLRAVTAQPSLRAGGKHNDLENVGYTARHHTFFEMLGNFSFGDYFKADAIRFAWDFLTRELGISPSRLWVTVFREDDEAADIWFNEIGIDPQRFSRCDEADNFWSMGDTGPCGPCSEIFYDHGDSVPGGPPGSPDADGDRYIEIWNLVFMQYDRTPDGQLLPLPKPSVDTGMGLERIASVLQGVHNNYDTDLFKALIQASASILGVNKEDQSKRQSLNVIADHIRSAAFLIADGITPSNEHRGYVLRRIIRRALRHGHKLGVNEPFFYRLVAALVKEMGETYPKLAQRSSEIETVLKHEEEQFLDTLSHGLKLLSEGMKSAHNHVLPGELVFRLYDTYGFPPDLTADVAREKGMTFNQVVFEQCMNEQRKRSQKASHFGSAYGDRLIVEGETLFTGYELQHDRGSILKLFQNHQVVSCLKMGEEGVVILDKTPFYAESGGQVGDRGDILGLAGLFHVTDTRKQGKVFLHYGRVEKGQICAGETVQLNVSQDRQAIMLNHSATHLLHAAMRVLLGEKISQKGSLVEASRLRFDFAYPKPLTQDQISAIERLVNEKIRENLPCQIELTSPEKAIQKGALALFGEKYDEEVRMLSMGDFSKELCGGTHVEHTGEIGLFKITNETGVAAGVRRIEAITGKEAMAWILETEMKFANIMNSLKANRVDCLDKLESILDANQKLIKTLDKMRQKEAMDQIQIFADAFEEVQDIHVLAKNVENIDVKLLRSMVDSLKQKKEKGVIVLTTIMDDRVHVVAGVTRACLDLIKAGELVASISERLGGQGGGRSDLAQGGGHLVDQLPDALMSVKHWVRAKLN